MTNTQTVATSLATIALFSAGLSTASAETVFRGVFRVIAVSAQCQNAHVGDLSTVSFHPFLAGQNDHSEGLSLNYTFGGVGYNLANRALDATYRPVVTGGLGWGGVFTRPSSEFAQIGEVTHAAITNTTPLLTLRGKIKRPDNDPGGLACVATFVASLVKDE